MLRESTVVSPGGGGVGGCQDGEKSCRLEKISRARSSSKPILKLG